MFRRGSPAGPVSLRPWRGLRSPPPSAAGSHRGLRRRVCCDRQSAGSRRRPARCAVELARAALAPVSGAAGRTFGFKFQQHSTSPCRAVVVTVALEVGKLISLPSDRCVWLRTDRSPPIWKGFPVKTTRSVLTTLLAFAIAASITGGVPGTEGLPMTPADLLSLPLLRDLTAGRVSGEIEFPAVGHADGWLNSPPLVPTAPHGT